MQRNMNGFGTPRLDSIADKMDGTEESHSHADDCRIRPKNIMATMKPRISDEYNKKNLLAAALSEARAVILYEQCGSARIITVVLSVPSAESQKAGDESTTRVSEYIFGMMCRPATESHAKATGGKHRNLQRLFLSASIWSPAFFIPHPAVFSDNVTGRRPRLAENDKLRANG